jgi:hypothetical protein
MKPGFGENISNSNKKEKGAGSESGYEFNDKENLENIRRTATEIQKIWNSLPEDQLRNNFGKIEGYAQLVFFVLNIEGGRVKKNDFESVKKMMEHCEDNVEKCAQFYLKHEMSLSALEEYVRVLKEKLEALDGKARETEGEDVFEGSNEAFEKSMFSSCRYFSEKSRENFKKVDDGQGFSKYYDESGRLVIEEGGWQTDSPEEGVLHTESRNFYRENIFDENGNLAEIAFHNSHYFNHDDYLVDDVDEFGKIRFEHSDGKITKAFAKKFERKKNELGEGLISIMKTEVSFDIVYGLDGEIESIFSSESSTMKYPDGEKGDIVKRNIYHSESGKGREVSEIICGYLGTISDRDRKADNSKDETENYPEWKADNFRDLKERLFKYKDEDKKELKIVNEVDVNEGDEDDYNKARKDVFYDKDGKVVLVENEHSLAIKYETASDYFTREEYAYDATGNIKELVYGQNNFSSDAEGESSSAEKIGKMIFEYTDGKITKAVAKEISISSDSEDGQIVFEAERIFEVSYDTKGNVDVIYQKVKGIKKEAGKPDAIKNSVAIAYEKGNSAGASAGEIVSIMKKALDIERLWDN